MSNTKARVTLACAAVCLMMTAATALAGLGASGCDDLGSLAETPSIDFQSQIQPVFNACASCHGESGSAGLDLRSGESYDNLVGMISTTNPGRLRVEPFSPNTSALFLAVNCDSPGGPGFRMPGTTPEQQALIRDWIAQGAQPEPTGTTEATAVPVDAPGFLMVMAALLGLLAALHFRKTVST